MTGAQLRSESSLPIPEHIQMMVSCRKMMTFKGFKHPLTNHVR